MIPHDILNEINEYEWWSYWAEHFINDGIYILKSEKFKEPLFNRVGFLSNEAADISKISKLSELSNSSKFFSAKTSFFVPSNGGYREFEGFLRRNGYVAVDSLDVFYLEERIENTHKDVEIVTDVDKWVSTYARSFEEDDSLIPAIRESVKKALDGGRVTLLAKKEDGIFSGVAAVYENEKSTGIYCVGVLPEYRHKKIGSSLVSFASAMSDKPVFLQAFASSSLTQFYRGLGFKMIYSKAIFVRDLHAPFNIISVKRDAAPGTYDLTKIFGDLDKVDAVKYMFNKEDLEGIHAVIENSQGYMHVQDGEIHISHQYLSSADIRYLYLDIVHELVHVLQHRKGMNLYDWRYRYFERPTEIEAYKFTIKEAFNIGMSKNEIIDYLRVEWVTEEEFDRFLKLMNLK